MNLNQDGLKSNTLRIYNKLSCMQKYSCYPFSNEYQAMPFKLKTCGFAYWPRHYSFLSSALDKDTDSQPKRPATMKRLPTPGLTDYTVFTNPNQSTC